MYESFLYRKATNIFKCTFHQTCIGIPLVDTKLEPSVANCSYARVVPTSRLKNRICQKTDSYDDDRIHVYTLQLEARRDATGAAQYECHLQLSELFRFCMMSCANGEKSCLLIWIGILLPVLNCVWFGLLSHFCKFLPAVVNCHEWICQPGTRFPCMPHTTSNNVGRGFAI